MPSVSIFGGAPRTIYIVLRETFTGDGSDTTFQLTSGVGNCTFDKGAWAAAQIATAYPAHITGTDKAPTYDSTNIITRNRISVSSIDANGLVTLDYAPRDGVSFYVWYWYTLSANDEITYYREDFVASMEEQGAVIAGGITVDVTNFDNLLSSADTTVQTALETIDDFLTSAELSQLQNIGATTISSTQWGYLGAVDQGLATTNSPSFAGLSLGTGELTCGSINRASGTLTLEIGGTSYLSIASTGLSSTMTVGDATITGLSLDYNASGSLTTSRAHYGLFIDLDTSVDKNGNTYAVYGEYIDVNLNSGCDSSSAFGLAVALTAASGSVPDYLYGLQSDITYSTTDNASGVYGFKGGIALTAGATLALAYGIYGLTTASAGTITAAYGMYGELRTSNAAAEITTGYGVYSYVSELAGTIGTGYAFYGRLDAGVGTKWGIYISGDSDNYLTGNLTIGAGTGELTCGSINRASGTLTLEIGGTAEVSITSTGSTFGGSIIAQGRDHYFGVNDTTQARLFLYGDNANAGGLFLLYLGANYDTTIDYYRFGVDTDDFIIGPSTDIDALRYDGGLGWWNFTVPVAMTGLKSGADQATAGAAAGELYHDTDDHTIKIGV